MTAAELFEIMRGVPREAWGELDYVTMLWVDKETDEYVRPKRAANELIGSMTAWLAGDLRIKKRQHNDGEMVYGVKANDGCYSVGGTHRTLVAALAAACKEAA